MKITIVGASGSGKTTLGYELSRHFGIPLTDLDELLWLPHWRQREESDFIARMLAATAETDWIVSGNHTAMRDRLFPQLDLLIWLDLPLQTLLWRAYKRSWQRIRQRQLVCNGNRESWSRLLGKRSILLWILTSYRRRRRTYLALFTSNPYPRTRCVRIRSDVEREEFCAL